MSLREVAHWTSESLSSLKRQSINDPDALQAKVDAISGALSTKQQPQEADYDREISDLVNVHFIIAYARSHFSEKGSELWTKLTEALGYTRPYVEEPAED